MLRDWGATTPLPMSLGSFLFHRSQPGRFDFPGNPWPVEHGASGKSEFTLPLHRCSRPVLFLHVLLTPLAQRRLATSLPSPRCVHSLQGKPHHTPSPHVQPTLASYSQGSPTPGLCTVCTLAAPTAEWPPSAENSSSGGCPGPRRPFLGPLSPVPAAGLHPVVPSLVPVNRVFVTCFWAISFRAALPDHAPASLICTLFVREDLSFPLTLGDVSASERLVRIYDGSACNPATSDTNTTCGGCPLCCPRTAV